MKARLNLKKKIKRKFVNNILLVIILFVLFFLLKNTSDISDQVVVKEINIAADNEKES
ncbi:MAG: hypothetical protein LKM44_02300 [Wolbachia endosymbiont of Meromenopon meropis]|nr:hypothetical protein [Wolbachia endosymbiont of Meromenopon meropis]